jgi:hypothetical protein
VDLELRHCVSEGTLSELDLAHVSKCALGRQQIPQKFCFLVAFTVSGKIRDMSKLGNFFKTKHQTTYDWFTNVK